MACDDMYCVPLHTRVRALIVSGVRARVHGGVRGRDCRKTVLLRRRELGGHEVGGVHLLAQSGRRAYVPIKGGTVLGIMPVSALCQLLVWVALVIINPRLLS